MEFTIRNVRMKAQYFIVFFVSIFVSLMTYGSPDRKIPADLMDFAQLGMPYNSHTENIHNFICIDSTVDSRAGTSSAEFSFDYRMDHRSIINALSGSLAVGVDYPLLKLGVGASIVDSFADDDFSASWTAHAVSVPDVVRLQPGPSGGFELSAKCEEYISLYGNDAERLMEKVGDEFISQINLGASILVQLRINFATRKQKEEFNAYATYNSTGLWELDIQGFINSLNQKEKRTISVEIKAYQNGGESASLAAVLPNDMMSCAIDDIDACKNAFEQAIIYVQNFSQQITNPDNYNVLSYTTSTYLEAGLFDLVPPSGAPIAMNEIYLEQLDTIFKQQLNDRNRAVKMLGNYSSYLNQTWVNELKSIKVKTDQNLYGVTRVADICYRYPYGDECSLRFNEFQSILKKIYDRSFLEMPPASIAIYSPDGQKHDFVGEQGVYGSDTTRSFFSFAQTPVVSPLQSHTFEIDIVNSEGCQVKMEVLNDTITVADIQESSDFDLTSVYTPELEEFMFTQGVSSGYFTMYCAGLGGDVELAFPVSVTLPAATFSIDSGNEQAFVYGISGIYESSADTTLINMNLAPIQSNTDYNLYFDMDYSDKCIVGILEGGSTAYSVEISTPQLIDLSEFLDSESVYSPVGSSEEYLPLEVICYGVGGDAVASLMVPIAADSTNIDEDFTITNLYWRIISEPGEDEFYVSLWADSMADHCSFTLGGYTRTGLRVSSTGRVSGNWLSWPGSIRDLKLFPWEERESGTLTCYRRNGGSISITKQYDDWEWDT